MIEALLAYVVLGVLASLAEGDWRPRAMARNTLLWPARVPRLLRGDPSPADPPGLAVWDARIRAALGSLSSAIEKAGALPSGSSGRALLTDARHDLVDLARRHAELETVLEAPENDLRAARAATAGAETHRLPALRRRVEHIERLYRARETLETRLEAGLAEVMNLSARLHLARATGDAVSAVSERIADIRRAVEGVEEAEDPLGVGLGEDGLPADWQPALQPEAIVDAEELPPAPTRDAPTPAEKLAFEEAFAPTEAAELPAVRPGARAWGAGEPAPGTEASLGPTASARARWTLAGVMLALGIGSLLYRVLVMGHLEQTAALFIGMPAMLAAVVALLPAARTYTGTLLKVMTLMLLLSGVFLAEGMICILMAAPLFYSVAIIGGILLDYMRSRSPAARVMAVAPLMLLAVEGVVPQTSAERAEVVSTSRVVAASPDEVAAALAARPRFDEGLPFYLRMGFPRPVRVIGAGLSVGDRRSIHFAGGEGAPGDLLLEVGHAAPGAVTFNALSDSSHIAHWLTWKRAEVRWAEVAPGQTRVEWALHYDRELDPWIWFRPTERYAVWLTAEYLLDCLLPPEVSG